MTKTFTEHRTVKATQWFKEGDHSYDKVAKLNSGDWIVEDGSNTYVVDPFSFAKNYSQTDVQVQALQLKTELPAGPAVSPRVSAVSAIHSFIKGYHWEKSLAKNDEQAVGVRAAIDSVLGFLKAYAIQMHREEEIVDTKIFSKLTPELIKIVEQGRMALTKMTPAQLDEHVLNQQLEADSEQLKRVYLSEKQTLNTLTEGNFPIEKIVPILSELGNLGFSEKEILDALFKAKKE